MSEQQADGIRQAADGKVRTENGMGWKDIWSIGASWLVALLIKRSTKIY
jgi:hypothetical protein